jgi:hypothetical protein
MFGLGSTHNRRGSLPSGLQLKNISEETSPAPLKKKNATHNKSKNNHRRRSSLPSASSLKAALQKTSASKGMGLRMSPPALTATMRTTTTTRVAAKPKQAGRRKARIGAHKSREAKGVKADVATAATTTTTTIASSSLSSSSSSSSSAPKLMPDVKLTGKQKMDRLVDRFHQLDVVGCASFELGFLLW